MLLFFVGVGSLNMVPVIAAGGAVTTWLWILALLLFFWPEGLAVIELTHRYPHEGGVYLWSKTLFGEFHGFVSGWCYFTNNVFYIPTLVLYIIGMTAYAGGPAVQAIIANRFWAFSIAVGILILMTWLNIRGLSVGKWVNNIGGAGNSIVALVLVGLAVAFVRTHGTQLHASDFRAVKIDLNLVNLFSIVCFSLVGLELASNMADEIRDPQRTLPRAVFWGGVLVGLLYISGVTSVLVSLSQSEIGNTEGIAQAVTKMADLVGVRWIVNPIVALMALAVAGTLSAWMAGCARVPFVAGVDHYLPAAFGKVHPRYGTPYVALIVQTAASCGFLAMSYLGTTLGQAFKVLLLLAVVLTLVPYVYMFGALIRLAADPGFIPARFSRTSLWLAGTIGGATTVLGIVVAFLPPGGEPAWQFEAKMIGGTAFFVGLGIFFFTSYSRRHAAQSQLSRAA